MHFGAVVSAFSVLAVHVLASGQELGCFDALPDGYTSMGTYSWQSSAYCMAQCSSYDYFALYDGNQCYCGSSAPSGSSGSCDMDCVGYPSETCGGSSAYNFFAQYGVDISSVSSATSATDETNTTSSTSSTEETTSTTSTSSTSSTSTEDTTSTTSSSSSTTTTQDTTSSASETLLTTARLTTVVENSSSIITSFVYVTQSQASASPSGSGSSSDNGKSSSSSSKGAIIGGVVGGVVGAIVIALALFFILRHRREEEYVDAESMVADDEAYEAALKSNPFASTEDAEADSLMMLGRRRLSEGSLADTADYGLKVLRVANPDDN